MKAIDLDSGYPVAVKKIVLSRIGWPASGLESTIWREVKILSSLSHKNIVEYLGSAGWGTGTTFIYTSLKAGNMNHLLEKFPAVRSHHPTLSQLTQQMLEALDYLAFRGLCHRDVKPDNILYMPINEHECIFQLADFGFATHTDLARTHCGSAMFMAPEMYFHTHPQTPKLDVWSLFVTIISINRTAGFDDRGLKHYEEVVGLVRIAATVLPYLSPMAREDPELRASASQMLVQCFESNGLTTPRGRVTPIPFLDDGPSRLQALLYPGNQSKAPVKLTATRKRDSLRPSRQIAKRWGTGRLKPAQYQPRKDKMRAPGPYWHS
ncbi:kinase-like domain-containing protein [Bisporella sp. PMI_857]|nr:kinase-like domain-containing protein [Bisporella sp. PMI_857]